MDVAVADAEYSLNSTGAHAFVAGMGSSDKPRSPGAERMRLYRRRRRSNSRVVRVEVADTEIEELVKRGYLGPNDRTDLTEIGLAASACLSDTLWE
jgi:hypothetical protein